MPQLVFLADIHNKVDAISQSLENAGVDIKGDFAVLLELEPDGDYLVPKSEYSQDLTIIFKDKPGSTDYKLVEGLMAASDNSVYAFDGKGEKFSVERQNEQRANIKAILKRTDVKNKALVVVIVGIAHLQYDPESKDWKPLQSTAYPGYSIEVGFPDGEDINSG